MGAPIRLDDSELYDCLVEGLLKYGSFQKVYQSHSFPDGTMRCKNTWFNHAKRLGVYQHKDVKSLLSHFKAFSKTQSTYVYPLWDRNPAIWAYLVGFAAGDGSLVQPNRVGFYSTDAQIIVSIKKWFQLGNPIVVDLEDRKLPLYTIMVYNKLLFDRLVTLGVRPRKSKVGLLPPSFTGEHLIAYLRGYFDTDGTLTYVARKTVPHVPVVRFEETGPEFVNWIADSIHSLTGVLPDRRNISKKRGYKERFRIAYHRKGVAMKIPRLFYEPTPEVKLVRKFRRYLYFKREEVGSTVPE